MSNSDGLYYNEQIQRSKFLTKTKRWTLTPKRRCRSFHLNGLDLWPPESNQFVIRGPTVIPCKFHRDCSSCSCDIMV